MSIGIFDSYDLKMFLENTMKIGAMSVYLTQNEIDILYTNDRFRGAVSKLPSTRSTDACAVYLGKLKIYLENDGGIDSVSII